MNEHMNAILLVEADGIYRAKQGSGEQVSLEAAGRASQAMLGFIWVSHEDMLPQSLGPAALAVLLIHVAAACIFWGDSSHVDMSPIQHQWSLVINVSKCFFFPSSNSINSTNYQGSSLCS